MPGMRSQTPEQNYLAQVFPLNDPDLSRIKRKLIDDQLDFKSVSGPEARILQFLIRGFGLKRIVELGTLYGFSAVAMAKALPKDGFVLSIEKSAPHASVARDLVKMCALPAPVEVHEGDALEVLPSLESRGPFDLVFIDANKSAYSTYLDWAEKNVRPGGFIVGDNTFLWGAVWGAERPSSVSEKAVQVMREFNNRLADSTRFNSILIPTFEGMTVAQKI